MNYYIRKHLMLYLSGILILLSLNSEAAGIAYSGSSVSSLSISSDRSETNYQYIIEIHIEGIDVSKVTFEANFQTLYLLAQKGGLITEKAIAGAQIIRLAFDFPANANLKNYFRVNKPNKIIISVPKT